MYCVTFVSVAPRLAMAVSSTGFATPSVTRPNPAWSLLNAAGISWWSRMAFQASQLVRNCVHSAGRCPANPASNVRRAFTKSPSVVAICEVKPSRCAEVDVSEAPASATSIRALISSWCTTLSGANTWVWTVSSSLALVERVCNEETARAPVPRLTTASSPSSPRILLRIPRLPIQPATVRLPRTGLVVADIAASSHP
ncbi:hypothetical protein GALL_500340 [mine drainage metagenome]|uniref:Uncharacterized protein n=1 Tax=mine drainage metagenome TaxID=410659 RepID=A0A1J5PXM9_9ZZZZ